MPTVGRSISELEVGQTATFTRAFSEEDVKKFADLTWDHNPYHTVPAFAAKGRFKKPIVHGLLVAAAFTHFGGDFFPGHPGHAGRDGIQKAGLPRRAGDLHRGGHRG